METYTLPFLSSKNDNISMTNDTNIVSLCTKLVPLKPDNASSNKHKHASIVSHLYNKIFK